MVKKLKQMADKQAGASNTLFDRALASSVKESAQQIWLAGMGAFSKAQEEGGKVFDALVKDGVNLQRKTQAAAEEKFGEVTNRMTNMAGDVGAKAGQHWDKLETIFEERVARSMKRLGVPSAKDMAALQQRIDALSAEVARLAKTGGATSKAGRSPKASVTPAKKASAARKTPAKRRTAAKKSAAASGA
ncbi:phasin family protein [Piscinibacter sakaiensis]|uniref:phasin family protein n=1 Tax=Piscinibacter sakaiensis TaxID=1547922 RepID=UPI003AB0F98F